MGVTKQRRAILNIVMNNPGHLTAEEVYGEVRKKVPGIGLGTVYRNLNMLADAGEIRRLYVPDEPVRFDRTTQPHEHLVCAKCGGIEDIFVENFILPDEFARPDIKLLGHSLVVQCICKKCVREFRHSV